MARKKSDREWQKQSSDAISAIRHEAGKTKVRFTDGTEYEYNDKRKHMYVDIKEAGSKGKEFNYQYRNTRKGKRTK
jgi:uncharacterized FlaG/YvyC family protein